MTFEVLQWAHDSFLLSCAAYPVTVVLAYFVVFALLTALCLPGAAALMLLAGAGFGLTWGSLLATLASTAGACLTMLGARYLLRHRVESRWAARLHQVNQGLQAQGAMYLLSLRLLPVIPFVPLNLISGLTRLPVWTFFWASAVGMLPGTVVYVYAGTQLATVRSVEQLWSRNLLAALAALSLLPLMALRLQKKPH